ncbi:MAG: cupin domain-containing protein, partial [Candidatus Bathyarchaeia archaeon]
NQNKIKVVRFDEGGKVELGKGSFSNLILTASNLEESNKNMLGYSVFAPGIDTKQKIHVEAEELAYVVSGSGKITVGNDLVSFTSGDSLFIPPGVPHGVRNDGESDIVMVFFFSSPEYPKTIDA